MKHTGCLSRAAWRFEIRRQLESVWGSRSVTKQASQHSEYSSTRELQYVHLNGILLYYRHTQKAVYTVNFPGRSRHNHAHIVVSVCVLYMPLHVGFKQPP